MQIQTNGAQPHRPGYRSTGNNGLPRQYRKVKEITIMKKLTSLFLALVILMCPLMAMAESFNKSVLKGEYFDSVATLDISDDGTAAFVETQLTAANRSFSTPYEHPDYYNVTLWDMLVLDYNTSDPSPRLRVWVRYYGTQYLNIEGVSFVLDGTTYTFTDVASDSRKQHIADKDAYNERALIIFDTENLEFLAALEGYCESFDSVEEMDAHPITMILHGDTDVTVSLDSGFMLDFLIVSDLFIEAGGLDYLQYAGGNPMTTK